MGFIGVVFLSLATRLTVGFGEINWAGEGAPASAGVEATAVGFSAGGYGVGALTKGNGVGALAGGFTGGKEAYGFFSALLGLGSGGGLLLCYDFFRALTLYIDSSLPSVFSVSVLDSSICDYILRSIVFLFFGYGS